MKADLGGGTVVFGLRLARVLLSRSRKGLERGVRAAVEDVEYDDREGKNEVGVDARGDERMGEDTDTVGMIRLLDISGVEWFCRSRKGNRPAAEDLVSLSCGRFETTFFRAETKVWRPRRGLWLAVDCDGSGSIIVAMG